MPKVAQKPQLSKPPLNTPLIDAKTGLASYPWQAWFNDVSGFIQNGVSGYSGYSGASADNNENIVPMPPPENTGTTGSSGFSGQSGFSGKSGTSGYSGSSNDNYPYTWFMS